MRKSVDHPAFSVLLRLLNEARLKAGLTQQQLADRLGEPQSFVAKYEGGERRLDLIELITLLGVLGANPVSIVRVVAAEVDKAG
jgi:transcriptional regulator with XRE-family HTH domain